MVSGDAPQFLDNDGDPPMWVRSDLATRPEEVLSWMTSEFGWDDEASANEVSGPFPMAPTISTASARAAMRLANA